MSTMSVRLPESLHKRVRDLAKREGISINQIVATALAEKMSAILTVDHLEARARRGSRSRFLAALARVPDVDPDPADVISPHRGRDRAQSRRPTPRRRHQVGQGRR